MKIVLIGYMGSGKTTIGNLLSSILKTPFYDLDAFIEKKEQQSISDIFSLKGELYFRKKETTYLKELLKKEEKLIIALGGGTPCFSNNLDLLHIKPDILTIYLKTTYKTLATRLFDEKNQRPLIAHISTYEDLQDFIKKHLFERSFYYSQSNYTINTDQLTPKELVEKIILQLF